MTTIAITDAALALAAGQPWKSVTLDALVAAAGMGLADFSAFAASRQDVLRLIARRFDQQLLASLQSDPVEGEPHDRLFDIMLRRIEQLAPHKPAIASIMKDPADGPAAWLHLLSSVMETQNWILIAAKLEASGTRGELQKLGLAKVYADTLKIWLDDDDAGLARTMAALDRKLRDSAAMTDRLERPLSIFASVCNALKAANDIRRDRARPQGSDAPAA